MKSITAVGLLFVSAALQLSSVAAGPCKNDSADPGCCLQMAEWTGNDGRLQRAPLVFDQLTGAVRRFVNLIKTLIILIYIYIYLR